MNKVSDIFDFLCRLAPLQLQMSFDNSGLLLGKKDAVVDKVLLALDVTDAVVDEAIEIGAQLIISHHPLIFSPISFTASILIPALVEPTLTDEQTISVSARA